MDRLIIVEPEYIVKGLTSIEPKITNVFKNTLKNHFKGHLRLLNDSRDSVQGIRECLLLLWDCWQRNVLLRWGRAIISGNRETGECLVYPDWHAYPIFSTAEANQYTEERVPRQSSFLRVKFSGRAFAAVRVPQCKVGRFKFAVQLNSWWCSVPINGWGWNWIHFGGMGGNVNHCAFPRALKFSYSFKSPVKTIVFD